jgi:hypothetical protein
VAKYLNYESIMSESILEEVLIKSEKLNDLYFQVLTEDKNALKLYSIELIKEVLTIWEQKEDCD